MKKTLVLALALSLTILLVSCSDTNISSNSLSTEDLEAKISSLSEEVNALKDENQILKDQIAKFSSKDREEKTATTVQDGDVTITMTGKSTHTDRYSQHYIDFVFTVKNNTDKSIKGVQGVSVFKDIFGVEILSLNCDFTGNVIEGNQSITVSDLSMDCNQFMDDHMKLYNTDYDDIVFEYTVKTIVFSDGTTKTN